ncbi:hypothetical protein BCR33DRAFT_788390 [Rhizoclosmatium globosum]|uniref:Translin-associated factor X-interacting protein 1 N-terminal domain-containing protein n=1 Tax=Rhizoclosmatium globosum TaxID=329046 RepID=A0A1Y2BXA5_9FUNG|nr:hypothetical protein BCR33DRAFT_788390 [Rhizoclosmatium globosum]|eukprot:ORY39383.1 hypothetical protein BCR33DRAFT_788390 [Rhizoclosmatium globosum]
MIRSQSRSSAEAHLAAGIISPFANVIGAKGQPRLLAALQAKIKHEMTVLNNPSDPSDPRKLQIYREVFERFISEFKTYESILSEIKTVYDMSIHAQNLKILELEPFKAKTATLRYEFAQEVDKLRQEAIMRLEELEEKNRVLQTSNEAYQSEISNLKGHLKALAEELRLKDAAGSEEEVMRSQIHYLQQQIELNEVAYTEELSKRDAEITSLQFQVQKKTDECKKATTENVSLKWSLGQKVPRSSLNEKVSENEALQKQIKTMETEISNLKAELEKANYNLGLKVAQIKKMQGDGKGNFPDWEYVRYNCPGQIQDWVSACRVQTTTKPLSSYCATQVFQVPSANNSSRRQQVIAPPTVEDEKYFIGMGLGSDIPKYLRYKGKVPNRMLSRKDITSLVNDIWTAKTVFDANPKNLKNLSEFLYLFLKKRFGSQDIVAEWGYNIYKASIKYSSQSADCQLFSNVLEGHADEEVFHQLQETIELLKNMFYKCDMALNSTSCGTLPKGECHKLMRQFWPEKTENQLLALKNAMDADQPGEVLSYSWLFSSDSDSVFLDLLKEQENELRESYIRGIQAAITAGSRDTKFSSQDVMRGLVLYDSEKPREDLDKYLVRGFALELEAIKPKTMIELSLFLSNLKRGALWHGKRKG